MQPHRLGYRRQVTRCDFASRGLGSGLTPLRDQPGGCEARGLRARSPVPDEGFAGRLVEASRVPACISKDSALLRTMFPCVGRGTTLPEHGAQETRDGTGIALDADAAVHVMNGSCDVVTL